MEMIAAWLGDIWQGLDGDLLQTARRMGEESVLPTQLVVDCKGLFDSVIAPSPGKLVDKGMILWISWLREAFHKGFLDELCWVPTESMLIDSATKWKEGEDQLWTLMYENGFWAPFNLPHLPEDYVIAKTDLCSPCERLEMFGMSVILRVCGVLTLGRQDSVRSWSRVSRVAARPASDSSAAAVR